MSREIILEPGLHQITKDGFQEIYRRYWKGDLSANLWNAEIASRMRGYRPECVGMDSFTPGFFYDSRDINELEIKERADWPGLPGSPEQMSGRDSIYVIAGDPLGAMFWTPDEKLELPEWLDFLKNVPLTVEREPQAYIKQGIVEGVVPLVAGTSLLIAAQRDRSTGRISRRSLLRLGGALAIGWTLGKLSPVAGSYTTHNEPRGILEKITEITKPRFASSNWLDARTALMITKTKEAMDRLGLEQGAFGSVVVGYPHVYEAETLKNSQSARQDVIRKYAQEIIDFIYQWPNHDIDNKDVLGVVLPYLAAADIYQVFNPNTEEHNLPKAAKEAIVFDRKFFSSETIDALRPMDTEGIFKGDFEAEYQKGLESYRDFKEADEALSQEESDEQAKLEDWSEELDKEYEEKRQELQRVYYSAN